MWKINIVKSFLILWNKIDAVLFSWSITLMPVLNLVDGLNGLVYHLTCVCISFHFVWFNTIVCCFIRKLCCVPRSQYTVLRLQNILQHPLFFFYLFYSRFLVYSILYPNSKPCCNLHHHVRAMCLLIFCLSSLLKFQLCLKKVWMLPDCSCKHPSL